METTLSLMVFVPSSVPLQAAEEYISDDMKKMIVLPEDAAEGEIVQNISQEAEDLHAEIWNQFKNACN